MARGTCSDSAYALALAIVAILIIVPLADAKVGVTIEIGTVLQTTNTTLIAGSTYFFESVTVNETHMLFNSSAPSYLTGIPYRWDPTTEIITANGTELHTAIMYYSETAISSKFMISSIDDGYLSSVPTYAGVNGRFNFTSGGTVNITQYDAFPSLNFTIYVDEGNWTDYVNGTTYITVANLTNGSLVCVDFYLAAEVPVNATPVSVVINATMPLFQIPQMVVFNGTGTVNSSGFVLPGYNWQGMIWNDYGRFFLMVLPIFLMLISGKHYAGIMGLIASLICEGINLTMGIEIYSTYILAIIAFVSVLLLIVERG